MAAGTFFGFKLKPVDLDEDGTIGALRLQAIIDANGGDKTATIKKLLTAGAEAQKKPVKRPARKAASKTKVA